MKNKNNLNFSIPRETQYLLDMYENGEITKEEYRLAMEQYWDELLSEVSPTERKRLLSPDENSQNIKNKIKSILKDVLYAILFIFCILLILFSTGVELYKIGGYCKDFIITVGNGSWVVGIILLPLSVYGAIQIVRGFCSLCDEGKINSTWNFILSIASIIALFFTVYRF